MRRDSTHRASPTSLAASLRRKPCGSRTRRRQTRRPIRRFQQQRPTTRKSRISNTSPPTKSLFDIAVEPEQSDRLSQEQECTRPVAKSPIAKSFSTESPAHLPYGSS